MQFTNLRSEILLNLNSQYNITPQSEKKIEAKLKANTKKPKVLQNM
jgi:hypothetical protein